MIEHLEVSLMNERRGQIQREVAANRLQKRLRQARVQRASLLSALLDSLRNVAGTRSGGTLHKHRTPEPPVLP